MLLVGIPAELGHLRLHGEKVHGRWSLEGVILLRISVPTWQ
jgi:hypothetical protein